MYFRFSAYAATESKHSLKKLGNKIWRIGTGRTSLKFSLQESWRPTLIKNLGFSAPSPWYYRTLNEMTINLLLFISIVAGKFDCYLMSSRQWCQHQCRVIGGGGNGIGLYHTYWRVVIGGFLITSFPDVQALAPAGAVVVAAAAAAAAVVKTMLTMERSRFRVQRASTCRYSTPPSTTRTSMTMMMTASRMVAVLPPMPAC
jgi:hypothetical protein